MRSFQTAEEAAEELRNQILSKVSSLRLSDCAEASSPPPSPTTKSRGKNSLDDGPRQYQQPMASRTEDHEATCATEASGISGMTRISGVSENAGWSERTPPPVAPVVNSENVDGHQDTRRNDTHSTGHRETDTRGDKHHHLSYPSLLIPSLSPLLPVHRADARNNEPTRLKSDSFRIAEEANPNEVASTRRRRQGLVKKSPHVKASHPFPEPGGNFIGRKGTTKSFATPSLAPNFANDTATIRECGDAMSFPTRDKLSLPIFESFALENNNSCGDDKNGFNDSNICIGGEIDESRNNNNKRARFSSPSIKLAPRIGRLRTGTEDYANDTTAKRLPSSLFYRENGVTDDNNPWTSSSECNRGYNHFGQGNYGYYDNHEKNPKKHILETPSTMHSYIETPPLFSSFASSTSFTTSSSSYAATSSTLDSTIQATYKPKTPSHNYTQKWNNPQDAPVKQHWLLMTPRLTPGGGGGGGGRHTTARTGYEMSKKKKKALGDIFDHQLNLLAMEPKDRYRMDAKRKSRATTANPSTTPDNHGDVSPCLWSSKNDDFVSNHHQGIANVATQEYKSPLRSHRLRFGDHRGKENSISNADHYDGDDGNEEQRLLTPTALSTA